ncbi:MAG TPA: peptidyl-alpha-hydroxyglycine alpha-amidating lyase family protein [Xanthobacteraceae bacterium]|jgi:sugar lactone lactonase YvrE|nr:peptidyl-alpha-hydroxyglycine alpha-amidating lyase family protein [Xanthobacteraceae bacterium]
MHFQARPGYARNLGIIACSIAAFLFAVPALVVVERAVAQVGQGAVMPTNGGPNPYRSIDGWGKLPPGRIWGSTSAVDIDPDGSSVWVLERCGAQGFVPASQMQPGVPFNCDGSDLDPVLKFDSSGKLVKSFGAGLLVFPHGIHVDREGNIWAVDGAARNGKGQQVIKFSPDGRVLLRLGKAGVAGAGLDEFNAPSSVVTAPNGDIFVGDGHGGDTNARIMKFSKDGKFIKTWGKLGSGAGEIDIPHTMAMDSQGRLLFVGDRNNNRIQIFDQDGIYLNQWKQFSRPSGVFIDKNDVIYVADSESESVRNSNIGWKRGIRVGSARTGALTAFIPDPVEKITGTSAAEGVAADAMGNIYGAEVGPKRVMKYVRQ